MKTNVEKITAERYQGDKKLKYNSGCNIQILCDMLISTPALCNDVLKTDFYC